MNYGSLPVRRIMYDLQKWKSITKIPLENTWTYMVFYVYYIYWDNKTKPMGIIKKQNMN